MISLTQENGESLVLRQSPKGIVSLVPSITETLIHFGTRPGGRTSFCIEPREEVRNIPVIGGTKTLKISKIISLKPDLVIANKEENRREDVEALRSAGLNVWVTYPIEVGDVVIHLKEISQVVSDRHGCLKEAEKLQTEIERFSRIKAQKRPDVLALIWKDPWMCVGANTYADSLIEIAGGTNLGRKREGRYPTLELTEILDMRPDLLLLPSEPFEFVESHREYWRLECEKRGLSTRVEQYSGEDLSWFGIRTESALQKLSKVIWRGQS